MNNEEFDFNNQSEHPTKLEQLISGYVSAQTQIIHEFSNDPCGDVIRLTKWEVAFRKAHGFDK